MNELALKKAFLELQPLPFLHRDVSWLVHLITCYHLRLDQEIYVVKCGPRGPIELIPWRTAGEEPNCHGLMYDGIYVDYHYRSTTDATLNT